MKKTRLKKAKPSLKGEGAPSRLHATLVLKSNVLIFGIGILGDGKSS